VPASASATARTVPSPPSAHHEVGAALERLACLPDARVLEGRLEPQRLGEVLLGARPPDGRRALRRHGRAVHDHVRDPVAGEEPAVARQHGLEGRVVGDHREHDRRAAQLRERSGDRRAALAQRLAHEVLVRMERRGEAPDDRVQDAVARNDQQEMENELGDVLFSLINYARFLHVDAENALAKTNNKFISRFTQMEQQALEQGKPLADMTLSEMDAIWDSIKKQTQT